MEDKLEILSVDLLSSEKMLVRNLKRLANNLKLEFGWHYLLDLTWILRHLGDIGNQKIMDAGAGVGIMQWHLASRGAEVVSVDRENRANLPRKFREQFNISGLRSNDLEPNNLRLDRPLGNLLLKGSAINYVNRFRIGINFRTSNGNRKRGKVILYNQDLLHLIDIPDDSFDSIVAVSALEHNPPDDLKNVISELLRVVKPGGSLLATVGAALEDDWYHTPSRGWCYSESTLRNVFDLHPVVESNFAQYDALFSALQDCKELRDNLARFYFKSGENGMPWGIWDPQYQPVGVCKVKRNS